MSDRDTTSRDLRMVVLLLITWMTVIASTVIHGDWRRERSDLPGYLVCRQGLLSLIGERPLGAVEEKPLEPHIAALVRRTVPVNQAEAVVLETIPGIGPELARRIVAFREQEGMFASGADLVRVSGIGTKRARQFQGYLTFD